MAAPTQTAADKASIAIMMEATTEGVYMAQLGSIKIGMGTGTPNGEVTAPIGSIFINKADGAIYRNTDGSTTWGAFN
jgi:hypothetical protein